MDTGWVHTTIGKIVPQKGLQTGPFGSQLKADEYTEDFGGVPVVMPQDILAGKIITDRIARTTAEKARQLSKHLLKEGDILFPRRGDLSRIGLVSKFEDGWLCGTGCLRARIGKNGDPRFLSFYLTQKCVLEWLEANAVGQTMLNLNTEIISNLPIYLPTLPEQRKIAEILGAWDRAIELTSALLAAARTRKRGLMQILLTGKCRFPEFAEEAWREVRLGDVASVDQQSLGSSTAPNFTFNYILLSDVKSGQIVETLQRFTFDKAPSRARRIVKPGDLLVSTVRPNLQGFARVTEQHQDCVASTGFAVVTPKGKVNGSYLFHYLFSHHMKSQFHSLVVGSNYPAVNSSDVKKLKVSLSSVAEQAKIGYLLNSCDSEILRLVTEIEALRIQKRGLMQKLLTGEWRVPLESASILMHTPIHKGG